MKRAVVMGVIVAGLIGFVGFVASRRSDRDGVRTGVWSGKTSQGLRIGRSWARRPPRRRCRAKVRGRSS